MFGFLIAFSWYLDSKVAVLGVMMSQSDLAADLGKKENEGQSLLIPKFGGLVVDLFAK